MRLLDRQVGLPISTQTTVCLMCSVNGNLKGPVPAGIAHLLEHMAFKGSVRLGTKDYQREAALLNAVDEGAALFHAIMILVSAGL